MCIFWFEIRYGSSPGNTPLSRYGNWANFGKFSYSFSSKFYTNLQSPVERLKIGPWQQNVFFHDPHVDSQVLSYSSPFPDEKTEILPTLILLGIILDLTCLAINFGNVLGWRKISKTEWWKFERNRTSNKKVMVALKLRSLRLCKFQIGNCVSKLWPMARTTFS